MVSSSLVLNPLFISRRFWLPFLHHCFFLLHCFLLLFPSQFQEFISLPIHEKLLSVSVGALHSVKSKHHQSHTLLHLNVKFSRASKTCPPQSRAGALQVWIIQASDIHTYTHTHICTDIHTHTYPPQTSISDLRNYASSGSQKPPQWNTEDQRIPREHKGSQSSASLGH